MKRFLFGVTMLACVQANAQVLHKPALQYLAGRQNAALLREIFAKQTAPATASKTTATQKRLVATTYEANGVPQDSTRYLYSSGRGSVHPNSIDYFPAFIATAYDFHQPYIKCDSSKKYDYNGSTFELSGIAGIGYDAQNRATGTIDTFSGYASRSLVTYNGNGQPVQVSTAFASPTPTSAMYIFYDGQNRRLYDSTYGFTAGKPSNRRTYTYDANGNLVQFASYTWDTASQAFQLSFENNFVYDGSNRLIFDSSRINFQTSMISQEKDSFTYTGTAKQYTSHTAWHWDNGTTTWVPDQRLLYHLNTAGNVDTYYIHQWMQSMLSYDTVERDVFYYGSDDLMLYTHGYLYLGNGMYDTNPYDKQTLYWQEYDPASVKDVGAKEQITIYPNPTTGSIRLATGRPLNGDLRITDVLGRCVLEEAGVALRDHIISLEHVPAGDYWLVVSSGGVILSRLQVARQ